MNKIKRDKEINRKALHKISSLLLVVLILFGSMPYSMIDVSAEEDDSSTGTNVWNGIDVDIAWYTGDSDAYSISTAAELAGLASLVNQGDSFVDITITLTANIDLGGEEWTTIGVGETLRFYGTFDGDGHTISNLTITSNSHYQGLFSSIGGAVIKNLGIINPDITGSSFVGGLVGYAPGSEVVIENCYTSGGSVSGSYMVGGLVGWLGGTLTSCSNEGTAVSTTGTSVGGLVGFAAGGTISNCYNTGTVSAGDYTYNIDVTHYESMYSDVTDEYTKNRMIEQDIADNLANYCGVNIGGIAGKVDWCSITNCYSIGDIVVGTMSVTLIESVDNTDPDDYYDQRLDDLVNGDIEDPSSSDGYTIDLSSVTYKIGGVAGATASYRSTVSNCYYDGSAISSDTEIDSILDGESLTSEDMTGSNALTVMNLDSDVWKATDGYPMLISSMIFDFEGSGIKEDPFQITTIDDLNKLAEKVKAGESYEGVYFVQTDNIEITGDYSSIGDSSYPFAGNYNGNGCLISGTVDASIFGYANTSATIQNLEVSATINGSSFIGGIVSTNYGIVDNCSFTGSINFTLRNIGGIVSNNYGTVSNCYNSGTISNNQESSYSEFVGGIVGLNYGTVSKCYNTGEIKGMHQVGGIVGCNDAIVENCYNTGTVSGTGDKTGGIAGVNGGTGSSVINCYNTGTVSGTVNVGGIVGENDESNKVSTCYNTGAVSGTVNVGGVVGESSDAEDVTYSYYNSDIFTGNTKYGTPLTTLQMTGTTDGDGESDDTNRALDSMTGFDLLDWIFTSDTTLTTSSSITNTYSYPVLANNPQTPVPFAQDVTVLYTVDITLGSNITSTSNLSQTVGSGTAITDIVITADSGYGFPTDYLGNATSVSVSGLTITRDSSSQVTISGTLTSTATLNFPSISVCVNAESPSITDLEAATYDYDATVTALNGTATTTDGGTITYQWYSSSDADVWMEIGGATNETYTPSNTAVGATYYKVVATNTITDNGDGGTKTAVSESDAVAITVEKTTPTFTVEINGEVITGITAGSTIDKPESPTKDGYYFIGWEVDGELWDFDNDVVTGDIKLVAVFVEKTVYDVDGVFVECGSGEKAVFTIHAEFSEFIALYFNGEEVSKDNYTVEEGSTIITLLDEYVSTFAVGEHVLTAVFEKGSAELTLVVTESQTDVDTGDNGLMQVFTAMMITSLLVMFIVRKKKSDHLSD